MFETESFMDHTINIFLGSLLSIPRLQLLLNLMYFYIQFMFETLSYILTTTIQIANQIIIVNFYVSFLFFFPVSLASFHMFRCMKGGKVEMYKNVSCVSSITIVLENLFHITYKTFWDERSVKKYHVILTEIQLVFSMVFCLFWAKYKIQKS